MRGAVTLVEILVVAAILAVLTAVLLPALAAARAAALAADTAKRIDAVGQALLRGEQESASRLHRSVVAPHLAGLGFPTGAFDIRSDSGTRRWYPRYDVSGTPIPRAVVAATDTYNRGFDAARLPVVPGAQHAFCLTSPWGRPALSATSEPGPPARLAVADFDPRASAAFLVDAGVLSDAAAWGAIDGAPRGRPWNDAWGHPLVVAFAMYQAPDIPMTVVRDQVGTIVDTNAYTLVDHAVALYGSSRAIYVATGAVGPSLRAGVSIGDPLALWRQICDVCDAARWDEAAVSAPPWQGLRRGRSAAQRCFLAAPLEIP